MGSAEPSDTPGSDWRTGHRIMQERCRSGPVDVTRRRAAWQGSVMNECLGGHREAAWSVRFKRDDSLISLALSFRYIPRLHDTT